MTRVKRYFAAVLLLICSDLLLVTTAPVLGVMPENNLPMLRSEVSEDGCPNELACPDSGTRIVNINQSYRDYSKYSTYLKNFDILEPPEPTSRTRSRRAAINKNFWPKSSDGLIYIPYQIRELIVGYEKRIRFNLTQAAAEFAKHTCYRLIHRTTEKDYIRIMDYNGCWSRVGKQGGMQAMSIAKGCEYRDVILHEFMHAIGFYHEQARRDRDKHIKIHYDNIKEANHPQYNKQPYGTTFTHGQDYDIKSLMQYSRKAGAVNVHKDAMSPIKFPDASLGAEEGTGFSESDKKEINYRSLCKVNVKVHDGRF